MKKFYFIILFILCSVSAFPDAYMTISSFNIIKGDTAEISINMTNDTPITAFQCDITLPSGLSFVKFYDEEQEDSVYASLSSRKKPSHTIATGIQTNGALRIAVLSTSNKNFSGTDGAVAIIKVVASKTIASGTYSISLSNVELSTSAGEAFRPDVKTSDVIVKGRETITIGTTNVGGTVSGGGIFVEGETATLTATADEGYHFVSWSNDSKENPLSYIVTKSEEINASFALNKYAVKYTVDGLLQHTDSVTFTSPITAWTVPTKEGYTFSGWSNIPATMPAKDVTIAGTFSVNSYNMIYSVDGAVYKKVPVTFGSAVTAEPAPTKEGYTFSGWSDIPTTMPAKDVNVSGTFSVNSYNITYIVDGTVYKTVSVEFGSAITLIDAPTKQGYKFSGWNNAPQTMPAKDIQITGSFISTDIQKIKIQKLVNVYNINGVLIKSQIDINQLKEILEQGVYIVNGHKIYIK